MPPTKPRVCHRSSLYAILVDQRVGISKNKHGILKTYPMFSFVSLGLRRVPLEPNHRRIV